MFLVDRDWGLRMPFSVIFCGQAQHKCSKHKDDYSLLFGCKNELLLQLRKSTTRRRFQSLGFDFIRGRTRTER